jgi:hypothetical protein
MHGSDLEPDREANGKNKNAKLKLESKRIISDFSVGMLCYQ